MQILRGMLDCYYLDFEEYQIDPYCDDGLGTYLDDWKGGALYMMRFANIYAAYEFRSSPDFECMHGHCII
jgi:hypothetical protein